MRKTKLSIILLLMLFLSVNCGYAQAGITELDLKIPSIPGLEMSKKISIEEAGEFLGKLDLVVFEKNDVWFGGHASFEYGDIWVEQVSDIKKQGYNMRLVVCKQEFTTQRGVKIGDSERSVLQVYGNKPIVFDIKNSAGDSKLGKVVRWIEYMLENSNKRIVFGIDKAGTVCYWGFSQTGGGI